MQKFVILLLIVFGLLPIFNVMADEMSTEHEQSQAEEKHKFLPGERATTRDGKKVRVWSTTGPVPVNNAPPAAPSVGGSNNGGASIGPVGVAVDGRGILPQRNVPRGELPDSRPGR